MNPVDITTRYDKAKRNLKFTQGEFAAWVGLSQEYFSIINKSNFTECSIDSLKIIDNVLKQRGY